MARFGTMRTQLLIGGEWREGADGKRIEVVDPSTGEPFAEVADGTPADAVAACEAAEAAQRSWATTAPRQRAEILRACWQHLLDHTDELAELIVKENGKPLADAKGEVAYAAEFFRWNAEETVRIRGELAVAPAGANRMIVHHPPVGVVAMITPWNFPAAMMTRKLAPALGAGNGVVVKPPKQTPLTALRVVDLLQEAGVPAGLVNVVTTNDAGSWFDATIGQGVELIHTRHEAATVHMADAWARHAATALPPEVGLGSVTGSWRPGEAPDAGARAHLR